VLGYEVDGRGWDCESGVWQMGVLQCAGEQGHRGGDDDKRTQMQLAGQLSFEDREAGKRNDL